MNAVRIPKAARQTQLPMATREQDIIILISIVPRLSAIISTNRASGDETKDKCNELNSQIQHGRTAAIL